MRGANGNIKKQSTAWQYLLGTILQDKKPLEQRGTRIHLEYEMRYPDRSRSYAHTQRQHTALAKAKYIREQWLERIERNGDALCHAQGYKLRTEVPGELLPGHIKYRNEMIARIDKSLRHTYSLSTIPREPQDWNDPNYYLCIAGRTIILHRSDSASWDNPKSKWPSSTSVTRTAYLMREGWDDLSKPGLLRNARYSDSLLGMWNNGEGLPERRINYEARGNWLPKVVIALLQIAPERHRGLSHIQLDPHYRISLSRKIAGIEIWRRTLAGETIDYCAVRGKDTYHASTPRAAVHGLSAKLATPGSRREILDMDYTLSLGFCRTGVEQFCEDYNLDSTASYTRAEIQAIVARGNGKAEKYERELAKAGITIYNRREGTT